MNSSSYGTVMFLNRQKLLKYVENRRYKCISQKLRGNLAGVALAQRFKLEVKILSGQRIP